MTRIVGGAARGRRLLVPARGTRPTSDRVRESLFSSLTSALLADGRAWSELAVLDLYAGSGALGMEAASRGASSVLMVEKARVGAETIRANIAALGLFDAELLPIPVELLLTRAPTRAHSLVLVDPPYDVEATHVSDLLDGLLRTGWVAQDALVVVERPTRDDRSPLPPDWDDFDQRRYGDTTLWYGRPTATTGE